MAFARSIALPRPESIRQSVRGRQNPQQDLPELMRRRDELAREFGMIAAEIDEIVIASVCGDNDDSQDVELYDGNLGVSRQFVDQHQAPVGQLRWLDDLDQMFAGEHTSAGNVAGTPSGTGALIESDGDDLFLTAGHCFDPASFALRGKSVPMRNGVPIPTHEIATQMQVDFNFQKDGATGQLRPVESFPVIELVDPGLPGVDYAIVRLGVNANGQRASELFDTLKVAAQDVAPPAWLCIIQHPNGMEKKIAAGALFEAANGQLAYNDLDVENGSSGAPVLAVPSGEIVGVHIAGGCERNTGFNVGQAIGVIRAASKWIK